MRTIYLDNNATTRVAPEVLEEMLPYFSDQYANPGGMYNFAGQAESKVETARRQVARLLRCTPLEVIFTSCGTESDNAAIMGVLEANPKKNHIVTTRVEHSAVINLVRSLVRKGYEVTELPVDEKGQLDLDELRDAITPQTAIVSVMYANNETGVIFPIEEIGKICKEREVTFHTDAVQAAGKIPLDMAHSTVDLLSISGHKLHAPKGVGVLYIRKGVRWRPFLIGGHQERGRRGGTENVPSIIALGKACELAMEYMDEENTRVKAMRDRLESLILEKIPGARVNGDRVNRLPNTTYISFKSIEGEGILLLLSQNGICASSGSACTSGTIEPSHVLRALGVPFDYAHGSVRFSFSRYNREEDVDFVVEKLAGIVERLRKLSPFMDEKGSAWLDKMQKIAAHQG